MTSPHSAVILYLGKPNLIKKEPLKGEFRIYEAIDRDHVIELLVERGSEIVSVVVDLDSVCQVKSNWAGTSSTTLGQRFVRQMQQSASTSTKILGVTTLDPLKELLRGAGCDDVCLSFDLLSTLVSFREALSSSS